MNPFPTLQFCPGRAAHGHHVGGWGGRGGSLMPKGLPPGPEKPSFLGLPSPTLLSSPLWAPAGYWCRLWSPRETRAAHGEEAVSFPGWDRRALTFAE